MSVTVGALYAFSKESKALRCSAAWPALQSRSKDRKLGTTAAKKALTTTTTNSNKTDLAGMSVTAMLKMAAKKKKKTKKKKNHKNNAKAEMLRKLGLGPKTIKSGIENNAFIKLILQLFNPVNLSYDLPLHHLL